MKISEASILFGISERRVRALCESGQIYGAFKIKGEWFIPDDTPKPFDHRFKSNMSPIETLEEKKKTLESLPKLNEGEKEALKEEFALYFTHESTTIEGNTLTLQETRLVLNGLTVNKPLKDHLEVTSHKEAFDFVCEMAKKNTPLTDSVIRQIHSLVLSFDRDNAGRYRSVPVYVSGASFTPVQPYLISKKIEELLDNYKKSKESLLTKLARFHIEFERIHPFIDGNGRMGRLILNLELMKEGYPPINIKANNKKDYYDAFDEYDKNGSLKAMEKLIYKYLTIELDNYINIRKAKV
ncbi:MAG: Fic family protein [Coprobacillus sp.]|nr:Fic family protein [Coprobacillus sp.]